MKVFSKSGFSSNCEVRKNPGKGYGVFATKPVKKGTIVWRHVAGEYEVYDEVEFRTAISDLKRQDVVYELTHVYGLDEFPNCLIRILDAGVLINHSDNANLATNFGVGRKIALDMSLSSYLQDVSAALLNDRFALVSTRDIGPGEEFTNNYSDDVVDPPFYRRLCEEYGVDESYLETGGTQTNP